MYKTVSCFHPDAKENNKSLDNQIATTRKAITLRIGHDPLLPPLSNSFVAEAGLSQTANQFAGDARGWLEIEGSSTKMVLTINILRHCPKIIFQKWELPAVGEPHETRSTITSAQVAEETMWQLLKDHHPFRLSLRNYINGRRTPTDQLKVPLF